MNNTTHIQTEIFCVHCASRHVLTLSKAGIEARKNGAFVQDAFPELTVGERELLISGTCDACWERFFPESD